MTGFARWTYVLLPSLTLALIAQFPPAAQAGMLYSTDSLGNILYSYDTNTGIGSVVSSDTNAINFPTGLALTSDGATLYLANRGANDIEKFNTATGAYTLFAGPSTGLVAPEDILLSPDGKTLYVANSFAGNILKFDTTTGMASVLATGLSYPTGLALAPNGTTLFVSEFSGNKIDEVNTSTGSVSPFASLATPGGLAVTSDGKTLYATVDNNPGSIYSFDIATGASTLFASSGLTGPLGLALTPDNSTLYVANIQASQILSYDTATAQGSIFATQPAPGYTGYLALFSGQSVPEPSSFVLCTTAIASLAVCFLGRRARASSARGETRRRSQLNDWKPVQPRGEKQRSQLRTYQKQSGNRHGPLFQTE